MQVRHADLSLGRRPTPILMATVDGRRGEWTAETRQRSRQLNITLLVSITHLQTYRFSLCDSFCQQKPILITKLRAVMHLLLEVCVDTSRVSAAPTHEHSAVLPEEAGRVTAPQARYAVVVHTPTSHAFNLTYPLHFFPDSLSQG
jgi:hypothetical protein